MKQTIVIHKEHITINARHKESYLFFEKKVSDISMHFFNATVLVINLQSHKTMTRCRFVVVVLQIIIVFYIRPRLSNN